MFFDQIQQGSTRPLNQIFFHFYGGPPTERIHCNLKLKWPVSHKITNGTKIGLNLGLEAYWDQFWPRKLILGLFGAGRRWFWLAIGHTCLLRPALWILIGLAVGVYISYQLRPSLKQHVIQFDLRTYLLFNAAFRFQSSLETSQINTPNTVFSEW